MQTYVVLMNWTEQGVKNVKEAPERIEMAAKAIEAGGGRLVGWYALLGQYDAVAIVEVPGDEAAVAQLLALNMLGNVRTITLRALTKEEFTQIVKKLD
jgi:uncharacterized protein with GYD domain